MWFKKAKTIKRTKDRRFTRHIIWKWLDTFRTKHAWHVKHGRGYCVEAREAGTMGTLAGQAGFGVWVQAPG